LGLCNLVKIQREMTKPVGKRKYNTSLFNGYEFETQVLIAFNECSRAGHSSILPKKESEVQIS
jgi:hypothetical protein